MLSRDHYADDQRLAARQRLWATSRRERPFELIPWVLDLAALGDGSTESVLDLGCGNGRFLTALTDRGHRGWTVASDLSHGLLAALDHTGACVQLDAHSLPFADDAFDVVIAAHMLYHLDDLRRATHECRRVLRPGGRLVATTNGPDNIIELIDVVESAVGGSWRMVMPHHDRFGMHNGGQQLAAVFDDVQRHDCPTNQTIVTDPDAVADYVASMDDIYGDQVAVEWSRVVEAVRLTTAQAIERHGQLRLTNAVGAFVCS